MEGGVFCPSPKKVSRCATGVVISRGGSIVATPVVAVLVVVTVVRDCFLALEIGEGIFEGYCACCSLEVSIVPKPTIPGGFASELSSILDGSSRNKYIYNKIKEKTPNLHAKHNKSEK